MRKTTKSSLSSNYLPMVCVDHRKMNAPLAFQAIFLLVGFVLLGGSLRAQQPASPSPSTVGQSAPAEPSSSSKAAKHRHTPFDDFLIRGTVFSDKALAFPGVVVRIRRLGEKKFRWQDVTNSRGDFAIRVPPNTSYELVTHAKGFTDQSKTVDAKAGSIDQSLSFQMEPDRGKK